MDLHVTSSRCSAFLLAAGAAVWGGAAAAQAPAPNSATLLAQATVVTERLGGRAIQPFYLAAPRAGRAVAVSSDERAAAAWSVDGTPGAAVAISFELPETIGHAQLPGADSLRLSFPAGAARWHVAGAATPARAFDPRVGTVGVFGDQPLPRILVALGATVHQTGRTRAGTYTGAVTLTVFYM